MKSLPDQLISEDIIEKAIGPWSSPIVLVKKKNGSYHFCMDYRKLSDVTKKDVHPLPRIDNTLDALLGAKLFLMLNLTSGYWQVKVEEDYCEKTAFVTPNGLRQFKVMLFCFCNAPNTF